MKDSIINQPHKYVYACTMQTFICIWGGGGEHSSQKTTTTYVVVYTWSIIIHVIKQSMYRQTQYSMLLQSNVSTYVGFTYFCLKWMIEDI